MSRSKHAVRRANSKLQRACPSIEHLEHRRMMYTTNGSWGVTNLSYSYSNFLDSAPGWADGLSRVDMQNMTEEAMGVWTAVTPLRIFARVDSGPSPAAIVGGSDPSYPVETHPTFRWGHHFIDGAPAGVNTIGHGNFPGTDGVAGDIHFDDANTFTIDGMLELGAHEFGHAIGMGHPNGEVVGGVCPGSFPAIMHACIGGDGDWDYNGLESGYLLADDIAGIRSLYGAGLGYVIDGFGELNVYGGIGDDLLTVDISGGNITVSSSLVGGGFAGSFTRALNDGQTVVNSIQLHGLGGNDILRVENTNGLRANLYGGAGDDFFDIGLNKRDFDGIGEVQVFAGAGNDSLFAYDNIDGSGQTYSVTSTRFDRPGWAGARFFDDLENRTLTTGNITNIVNVFNTSANRPTLINNGGGADIVNLGTNNSLQQIQGSVQIQNDPSFTTLNLNNSADTVARTLVVSQVAGNLGQLTGLAPGIISWDNADIQAINITTGTGADAVNVFGLSELTQINNAGGRDTFNVGSSINGLQGITGNLTIRAFFGTDSPMVLNDAANTVARTASMTAAGIDFSIAGLAPGLITYRDFGEVTVLQGSGGDTFNFNTRVTHRFSVEGNGGNDAFVLNAVNNYQEGLGGTFVSALNLDGGSGFNALSINDAARTLATGYQLFENRFFSRDPSPFAEGADFTFDNMGAIGVTCNNLDNSFSVFGVSTDIDLGNQVTLNLNGGNDAAFVYPHNAAGDLTINGNIGIIGGFGTETLTIEDAAASAAINYSFSNPFGSGTQNVFGLGTQGGLGTATIETIRINAGSGADTFAVNQFTSGVGLGIKAGGGDDVLQFGNNGLAAITSFAFFDFDGEEDRDTFNLNNQAHTGTWTYTRNAGSISAASTLGASYSLTDSNNEIIRLNGGPSGETFNINVVAPGTTLDANGAGGVDLARLTPSPSSLESIQGLLSYNAGTDGGSVVLFDQFDSTGDTFHLTPTALGAAVGDNLFGPGGSLNFSGLTDTSVIVTAILLHLGSGSDTGYVQPLASGTATINYGAQNFGPELIGDALNLALAQAANYVITPGVNGSVTSDNTGAVRWTGLELPLAVDDVAPTPLTGAFAFDLPAQNVAYTFSEDVSATLATASVILTNLTTNEELSQGVMSLAYDVATNTATVTFPGLPNGALPDGDYHAALNPGYSDFFGNAATTPLEFDFFFLQGDADHDRTVDISDFAVLASNFNSGTTFSQGDFDYSGLTDIGDFAILAAKFNQSLPAARRAPVGPSRVFGGRLIGEDELLSELV